MYNDQQRMPTPVPANATVRSPQKAVSRARAHFERGGSGRAARVGRSLGRLAGAAARPAALWHPCGAWIAYYRAAGRRQGARRQQGSGGSGGGAGSRLGVALQRARRCGDGDIGHGPARGSDVKAPPRSREHGTRHGVAASKPGPRLAPPSFVDTPVGPSVGLNSFRMSKSELACVYAVLALADDGLEVTVSA